MKKNIIWITLVALIVLGTGYYFSNEMQAKNQLTYALEADHQREFYNLVTHMDQTQILLGKSLVSGSDNHTMLYLTEVWNRAFAAKTSLEQLPFTNINMASSRKFLSQIADYSYSLAENMADGKEMTDAQYEQINKFYDEVKSFSVTLHQTEAKLNNNNFKWTSGYNTGFGKPAVAANENPHKDLTNFVDIEKRVQGLPSLVYDGPFSDHLEFLKPMGLGNKIYSQKEAEMIALNFLQNSLKKNYQLSKVIEFKGKIPGYTFSFTDKSKEEIRIDVSKMGGKILTVVNGRNIAQAVLKVPELSKKVDTFLKENNYPNMVLTYFIRQGNMVVYSYAYKEKDVIIYPDLIKVKAALDNGEILGIEAFGYAMSHHTRILPMPKLTLAEAKEKVNPRVSIKNMRLTMIPLANGKEILAYEIKGKLKNEEYLVYINALTGTQENILRIFVEPQGQLAI
jgi:spore germination protein